MAERKTKIDPSEFSESGYWAIRLEYLDPRDNWLPLTLPGVKAEYAATKHRDAINRLYDDLFNDDRDGFRARARLLAVLEIRIAIRRVSPYKDSHAPTTDLRLTVAKALRGEGIPTLAPGYPDLTPTGFDPPPKHDPYTDKPVRKRTPELRGSLHLGPPSIDIDTSMIPDDDDPRWDWGKRLADFGPEPPYSLVPDPGEEIETETLIEASPFFDKDGFIEEPMQKDIPIELLPERAEAE